MPSLNQAKSPEGIPCGITNLAAKHAGSVEKILRQLKKAGIYPYAANQKGDEVPDHELIFLDPATDETTLCSEIRKRQSTRSRLLGVIPEGEKLAPGKYFSLLNHGLKSLIHWKNTDTPVTKIKSYFDRWQKIDSVLRIGFAKKYLAGRSPVWLKTLREVAEVALFSKSNLLITGESGTGKENIARFVHEADESTDKGELVLTDCTTINPELAGSEFYGHEKGAFTGALASRDGAFSLAHGGTLFLDEVGDLPPSMQSGLLRVIQEGAYKKVGSNFWKKADFRLVSATLKDLDVLIEANRFREDLYFRLSGWEVKLPPLRERRSDIPVLIQHFLNEFYDNRPPEIDEDVMAYIMSREYRGNVRELRYLIRRISVKYTGEGPISLSDIPECDRPGEAFFAQCSWQKSMNEAVRMLLFEGMPMKEIKNTVADMAIDLALELEADTTREAARRLGISDRALQLNMAARKQSEA